MCCRRWTQTSQEHSKLHHHSRSIFFCPLLTRPGRLWWVCFGMHTVLYRLRGYKLCFHVSTAQTGRGWQPTSGKTQGGRQRCKVQRQDESTRRSFLWKSNRVCVGSRLVHHTINIGLHFIKPCVHLLFLDLRSLHVAVLTFPYISADIREVVAGRERERRSAHWTAQPCPQNQTGAPNSNLLSINEEGSSLVELFHPIFSVDRSLSSTPP